MDTLNTLFTSEEIPYLALRMLLILAITLLVSRVFIALTKNRWKEHLHQRLVFNITRVLIYVVGIAAALQQIPSVSGGFEALLAGSGIAALAISLGAQESLGNFINGIVISASKPFEVGDRIRLINGGITGYIEDITMRHTVVRTFMNSRIIIPNSVINKDMIENSNFLEERASGFLDIIITYDSEMERAIAIMTEVIGSHPNYVDPRTPAQKEDPKVAVYVRALSIYGVELRASVWTASINTNFDTCSEIRHKLKLAFDAAGIRFARAPAVAPLSFPQPTTIEIAQK